MFAQTRTEVSVNQPNMALKEMKHFIIILYMRCKNRDALGGLKFCSQRRILSPKYFFGRCSLVQIIYESKLRLRETLSPSCDTLVPNVLEIFYTSFSWRCEGERTQMEFSIMLYL